MDYHKSTTPLRLREYGRHIQDMAERLLEVEDRQQRTRLAELTVAVMAKLHPRGRGMENYEAMLWDHLHQMCSYELDVDGPYPKPEPPAEEEQQDRLAYHRKHSSLRQYGRNVDLMIEKALEMPEGEVRDAYVRMIASYMKLSAQNDTMGGSYNVNDEMTFEHLKHLSKGELVLESEEVSLQNRYNKGTGNISNKSAPVYQRKKKKKKGGSGGPNNQNNPQRKRYPRKKNRRYKNRGGNNNPS